MRRALLAAALLCALALPAYAATISINSMDRGGSIDEFEMWWKRVAASGVTVRINAPCISACTMVLGLVPPSRICITPRAKFGIHMAALDDVPNKRLTRQFVRRYYPQWVQAWLKTKPPLTDDLTWLRPADIGGHLKHCR